MDSIFNKNSRVMVKCSACGREKPIGKRCPRCGSDHSKKKDVPSSPPKPDPIKRRLDSI